MTYRIEDINFERFKRHLQKLGFKFESRPNQLFLARYPGFTVNLFKSGKVTFGGKDDLLQKEVEWYLQELGAEVTEEKISEFRDLNRIGTDESGKGDFFGPLVVAGVLLSGEKEDAIRTIGVRDSKKIRSRNRIAEISGKIRSLLGGENCEIVLIGPARYNELHDKLRNMNTILGWAHARAIENLLSRNANCEIAIADQFGDPDFIDKALMKKGKRVRLIQIHRGEIDLAVAAASILARDRFLKAMKQMSDEYQMEFPRGAMNMEEAMSTFLRKYGKDSLCNVAKLNFSIARRID